MDKVLAEIQRRIALAKAATPGVWYYEGRFPTSIENESTEIIRSDDYHLDATPADLDFVCDSGSHRVKELEVLEQAYRDVAHYCGYLNRVWTHLPAEHQIMFRLRNAIERAILGSEGDKGDG